MELSSHRLSNVNFRFQFADTKFDLQILDSDSERVIDGNLLPDDLERDNESVVGDVFRISTPAFVTSNRYTKVLWELVGLNDRPVLLDRTDISTNLGDLAIGRAGMDHPGKADAFANGVFIMLWPHRPLFHDRQRSVKRDPFLNRFQACPVSGGLL
ncbi:hypothetical protein LOC68_09570 [Blastopirellula sp. JC732]|uniref:Uncharacterized protein n=1 Tax=Blastopirellula sediminis TaxID=2894196 RepID=A0A9X1SGF8_9BACT|nr:hypothetical protein [Blastopirellula sediminis]MCC9628646.1 hypothetical protein [Blastopirellula sediminis]